MGERKSGDYDLRFRTFGFDLAPQPHMGSPERVPRYSQCVFTDSAGIIWTVVEKRRELESGPGFETVLVFESQSAFRCVRSYPGNWMELGGSALERLSWEN
jgi:hypothetical protein